jgi:hypothetical protein
MHDIEMQEMSPDFLACWQAAGMHLNEQVDGGIQSWLRAHPYPPVLEHLSFRLGNQLFFVRVEDAVGKVEGPGSRQGLLSIAEGCKGHACLMPMKKKFFGDTWITAEPGWGLIDAETGDPVNPFSLVTDEKIEVTNWELHDFAVQIVRHHLEKDGYQLMSWQGNPDVDPAIWFVGDSKKPEWVVIRATQYPEMKVSRPANWQSIAENCSRLSEIGHFACVSFASKDNSFESGEKDAAPIYRGYAAGAKFDGLDSQKAERD